MFTYPAVSTRGTALCKAKHQVAFKNSRTPLCRLSPTPFSSSSTSSNRYFLKREYETQYDARQWCFCQFKNATMHLFWNGSSYIEATRTGVLYRVSLNKQHLHVFSYDTDSHSLCHSESRRRRRGTVDSEDSSGYEREKQVGNTTHKIIPSCRSLFTNGWYREEKQCIHTTP